MNAGITIRDAALLSAMGLCTHDEIGPSYPQTETSGKCLACGYEIPRVPFFSTQEGLSQLWAWSTTQPWWDEFYASGVRVWGSPVGGSLSGALRDRVNPDKFADAVLKIVQEKQNA